MEHIGEESFLSENTDQEEPQKMRITSNTVLFVLFAVLLLCETDQKKETRSNAYEHLIQRFPIVKRSAMQCSQWRFSTVTNYLQIIGEHRQNRFLNCAIMGGGFGNQLNQVIHCALLSLISKRRLRIDISFSLIFHLLEFPTWVEIIDNAPKVDQSNKSSIASGESSKFHEANQRRMLASLSNGISRGGTWDVQSTLTNRTNSRNTAKSLAYSSYFKCFAAQRNARYFKDCLEDTKVVDVSPAPVHTIRAGEDAALRSAVIHFLYNELDMNIPFTTFYSCLLNIFVRPDAGMQELLFPHMRQLFRAPLSVSMHVRISDAEMAVNMGRMDKAESKKRYPPRSGCTLTSPFIQCAQNFHSEILQKKILKDLQIKNVTYVFGSDSDSAIETLSQMANSQLIGASTHVFDGPIVHSGRNANAAVSKTLSLTGSKKVVADFFLLRLADIFVSNCVFPSTPHRNEGNTYAANIATIRGEPLSFLDPQAFCPAPSIWRKLGFSSNEARLGRWSDDLIANHRSTNDKRRLKEMNIL